MVWIEEAPDSTCVLPLLNNNNFAMQWALMTLLYPTNSYANLLYVGYPGDFSSAFTVTRKRRVDRKKQHTRRNVFQCYVFGARGSGKTSLLQSFIGRYMLHFLLCRCPIVFFFVCSLFVWLVANGWCWFVLREDVMWGIPYSRRKRAQRALEISS
jgi:hypothetical protein